MRPRFATFKTGTWIKKVGKWFIVIPKVGEYRSAHYVLKWLSFWQTIWQSGREIQKTICFVISMGKCSQRTPCGLLWHIITNQGGSKRQVCICFGIHSQRSICGTAAAMPLHYSGYWDILPWQCQNGTVIFTMRTLLRILTVSPLWHKSASQKRKSKEDETSLSIF